MNRAPATPTLRKRGEKYRVSAVVLLRLDSAPLVERLAPMRMLRFDFGSNRKFDITCSIQRIRIASEVKKKDISSFELKVLLVRLAGCGLECR